MAELTKALAVAKRLCSRSRDSGMSPDLAYSRVLGKVSRLFPQIPDDTLKDLVTLAFLE